MILVFIQETELCLSYRVGARAPWDSPPPPPEFLFPTMNFPPSPLKDLTQVNDASIDIKDSSVILVILGHAQH